jgi:hypothetical protein
MLWWLAQCSEVKGNEPPHPHVSVQGGELDDLYDVRPTLPSMFISDAGTVDRLGWEVRCVCHDSTFRSSLPVLRVYYVLSPVWMQLAEACDSVKMLQSLL